jgi:predicted transcriptional regulator of viral defense system
MKPLDYFAAHPVFRLEDFTVAHQEGAALMPESSLASIKQHLQSGNLLRVRRGIYAYVPRGKTSESVAVDPFALAGLMARDAVIAYHGALQFHGKAHASTQQIPYFTLSQAKSFVFRGTTFVPVAVPPPLRKLPDLGGGIASRTRSETQVRVTTLERTLVDVLDAQRHGGGWEEIWRSLESIESLDLDAVINYAFKLRSAVAVAKVGFYLDQHREALRVEDRHLDRLSKRMPRCPIYLERGKRESGRLLTRWNLIVPEYILNRTW